VALCFDIAVQNGGLDPRDARRLQERLAGTPPTPELARRVIIAEVVAAHSQPAWRDAVQRRKRTLATGQGQVNQARYALATWGLDEVPTE